MVEYNMTYSNIVNSLVVQFFLVACVILFLLIGSEPRSTFLPPYIRGVLGLPSSST
jgi:hypothetical protein